MTKKRRRCSGHARSTTFAAPWPNETKRRGKDRARSDEDRAPRALDELESLAHLARTAPLLCAKAGLRSVRSFPVVPKRQNFPANRRGAEIRENGLISELAHATRLARHRGDGFHRALLFDGCAGIVSRAFSDPRQKALRDRPVHFARL